jgi:hypothetical protein
MPVHPDDIDAIADRVTALYREAELSLVATIRAALDKGWESPRWAEDRLAGVRALRRAAQATVAALSADASHEIRAGLADAYRRGGAATLAEVARWFPGVGAAAQAARREVTQVGAIESLAAALVRDIGQRTANIVRDVVDAFRAVVAAATTRMLAANLTRRQAAQAAWQGLMDRGITSFVDTSGRRWQLASYVEMATRTVTQRAAVQGQTDRLAALGVDLVYVSNSPQECPLCRPYEGRVLRRGLGPTGTLQVADQLGRGVVEVDVVATLDEARLLGLFHPNCRHSVSAFLPGVTRLPAQPTADPEGDRARQRQRAIERHISRSGRPPRSARWIRTRSGPPGSRCGSGRPSCVTTWPLTLASSGCRTASRSAQATSARRRIRPAASNRRHRRPSTAARPGPPVRHPPTGVARAGGDASRTPADTTAAELPGQGSLDEALADPLHGVNLAEMDADQLADLFAELSGRDDTPDDAFERVLVEMDRREAAATPGGFDLPEETAEQRRIDELVDRGWDYLDAYADVYGQDPEQLQREQRAQLVERQPGETVDQAVRRAYDEWVHLQYLAAEDATRGHLLSAAGTAEGIDPVSLFSGTTARARKYASEDLLRWWADNQRLTFTAFKAEVLGRKADIAAAEATRLQGNGRDFI